MLSPRSAPEEIRSQLGLGMTKRLIILYRFCAGNALYFYDHDLNFILDEMSLFSAEQIVFTNIRRAPGEGLEGDVLMDQDVEVHGLPSPRNSLKLQYQGGSYWFKDEYSLMKWSGNTEALVSAKAYLQ